MAPPSFAWSDSGRRKAEALLERWQDGKRPDSVSPGGGISPGQGDHTHTPSSSSRCCPGGRHFSGSRFVFPSVASAAAPHPDRLTSIFQGQNWGAGGGEKRASLWGKCLSGGNRDQRRPSCCLPGRGGAAHNAHTPLRWGVGGAAAALGVLQPPRSCPRGFLLRPTPRFLAESLPLCRPPKRHSRPRTARVIFTAINLAN